MIATLLGTLAVAIAFVGIGRLAERIVPTGAPDLVAPTAWLIAGWSLASFAAALCAAMGIQLLWPAIGLGVIGIAGYLVPQPQRPLLWLGIGWLMVAPLVLIASTIPPTMFDEFAHWLPNTRFLVEHGQFPDIVSPNVWSFKPSYPPAIPIVGYGVHGLTGRGSEIAAKIFSVLLAASFGLVLAECVSRRLGVAIALAIGVAFATVINPFFDPRTALTAYADTPTGFVLGYLIFVCWRDLDEPNARGVWRAVSAAVLLVLLRETNIVLVAGVAIGLALTNRRGRVLGAMAIAAAIGAFLLWRGYVISAAMPPAMMPRALAEWRWDAPWLVVRSLIVDRLANNPLLGGAAFGLLMLAAAAFVLHRRIFQPLRHLLLLAGTAAAVWTAFLLWSYIAVFNDDEIARAASAWRYMSQLGPTLILVCFGIVAAAIGEKSIAPRARSAFSAKNVVVVLACMIPGGLVLATRAHWQIQSQYPGTRAIHEIATALKPIIGDEPLDVVHPVDAPGFAIEIDYDLHRPVGASVPFQTIDQAGRKGYLLDAKDVESARCPRLMRWTEKGWGEVAAAPLLRACTGRNAAARSAN